MNKSKFETVLLHLSAGLEIPTNVFLALKAHMSLPKLCEYMAYRLWICQYPECSETRELRKQLLSLEEDGFFTWYKGE